ncbi:hypothetical protein RHMOL_Rhmol05G0189600 [Rhododendron molle]|uniref:Uncharacterized protein n=1 Tax=Rhododendron molle TaxID=49168 RepID=A0ACC0NQH4_RHOML|nr:hypothetical protein RHMOL_Rhmol05G0189600 [Rhododendron molle]
MESSIVLLCKYGGHDNCVLDNDADFVNMFALAGAYRVSCVDVVVEVLSSYADHNNRSIVVESVECRRSFEVGQSSTMHEVEEDPLEREFKKNHNCVGVFASLKNPRMSSKLVAKEIMEEVRTMTNYAPIEAVKFFEKYYGSKISYHHAWFGVEKAGDELYGDYALSFDLLRWYAEEAKAKNPGSVIDVEYCDKTNCFSRIFVAFDACIKGFNYCRPLLALDGTFLKGRYTGTLFGAIGKDGDQG